VGCRKGAGSGTVPVLLWQFEEPSVRIDMLVVGSCQADPESHSGFLADERCTSTNGKGCNSSAHNNASLASTDHSSAKPRANSELG